MCSSFYEESNKLQSEQQDLKTVKVRSTTPSQISLISTWLSKPSFLDHIIINNDRSQSYFEYRTGLAFQLLAYGYMLKDSVKIRNYARRNKLHPLRPISSAVSHFEKTNNN